MKKFALAIMCAMSVIFMLNCSKKGEVKYPSIKFLDEAGLIYQNTMMTTIDTIRYKIKCDAADDKDLITNFKLKLYVTEEDSGLSTFDLADVTLDNVATYTYDSGPNTFPIPCEVTVRATAVAASGQSSSAEIVIISNESILEEENLTWKKINQQEATGLSQFGLRWVNMDNGFISIRPINSGTTLVKIDSADNFSEIQTESEKIMAFEDGEWLKHLSDISYLSSATFNYLICTMCDGEYYLINLTSSEVVTDETGTTVTIFGRWK